MASNKNQHFVPRCYLRPFTVGGANRQIHLYNVDRQKVIEGAPVRHQCSGDYFYGNDPEQEKGIQAIESAYAETLRQVLSPEYRLTDDDRHLLKLFWLLQHLRTEAASRRSLEMAKSASEFLGFGNEQFQFVVRAKIAFDFFQ